MAGPGTMTESDGVADAASGITEVQFSPPREMSQMYRIERQRTGDNFEVVASWGGDFGNTNFVTKNNKEFEKLKRDVPRLSRLLNHRNSGCSDLKKDNAKKDEQLKHAHQQIEARDTVIRNLKRANVEHTPVPVRKPPLAIVISNGGSKERKLAHLPSNREDPMMAPIPKLLESRHHTMNDIALSTSKSTGVKTTCVQDGNINNDYSTTSNSLYGEQICRNLRAIWEMARLRQSCQTIGQVERMKETKLRNLVQGSLAVSRGIGDSNFKQWVVSEPETQTIQIGSKSEFVILASDGLWDKVTNQEAISTVHPFFTENHKTESIASSGKKLVELSILKRIGG